MARIVGLLLAAGKATRFGGGKLEALHQGQMLGLYAAKTLRAVCTETIAICAPQSALIAPLEAMGYRIVLNQNAAQGLSSSLSLGLVAADTADAVLVMLGDMPNVTIDHLHALIAAYDGIKVVSSAAGERRSPPAIVPRFYWPRLTGQTGDHGARHLLLKGLTIRCDSHLLFDVDNRNDLERLI